MAFTEASVPGTFNGTSAVTILAGVSSGPRYIAKFLIIHNKDTVTQKVTLSFRVNGVSYEMFTVSLDSGDTLVQDIPIVLTDDTYSIQASLGAAATTTQPVFIVTYGVVS